MTRPWGFLHLKVNITTNLAGEGATSLEGKSVWGSSTGASRNASGTEKLDSRGVDQGLGTDAGSTRQNPASKKKALSRKRKGGVGSSKKEP